MITGKDSSRRLLAQKALASFQRQTYKNTVLIIVNHGSFSVLDDLNMNAGNRNCKEFHVSRDTSLGSMRNASLREVPLGAVFATFDDDDYRPNDYLEIMKAEMDKANAYLIACANRFECNLNNEFVWRTHLRKGLPNTIMARRVQRVEYNNVSTMEDVNFIENYHKQGNLVRILDNDPHLYIRAVHRDNTSLFVDTVKSKVNRNRSSEFGEYDVSGVERIWVRSMLFLFVFGGTT